VLQLHCPNGVKLVIICFMVKLGHMHNHQTISFIEILNRGRHPALGECTIINFRAQMIFYKQRYPESVKIESQRSINRSSRAGASTEARWHSSGRHPGSGSRSEGGPGRQPVGVRQPVGGRAEPGVAGGPSCKGRVGWAASRERARLARER